MKIFFESYQPKSCCLCGSSNASTGEHKIKSSALREIFGREAMIISDIQQSSPPRMAQGPKSREFHFSARMCALCNSSRTQPADREFVKFNKLISRHFAEGVSPSEVFTLTQYTPNSEGYLNVFRYFAKILCCQIAESSGPRPIQLSKFATGEIERNTVTLIIDADPVYTTYCKSIGEHKYAAHGGLIVPFNAKTHIPTSFLSSITLGAVRYTFRADFGVMAGLALRLAHFEFWKKCEIAYQEALTSPSPE
ncbi:hypothetical protein ACX3YG_13805 [Pseudomonas wadenswilerensis]